MLSLINRIEAQVLAVIAEKFGAREQTLTLHTDLRRDLGADSLAMVELVMLLETTFDVDIPDEDVVEIATVEQVVKYLKELEISQLC
jgi:acyl carrier protein